MHLKSRFHWILGASLATLIGAGGATAREPIGATETVLNTVLGNISTRERTLGVADSVFAQELISTRAGSATDLRFHDDTIIKIGPLAQVELDEFVYNPNGGVERVGVALTKGTLRFVSGAMRKSAYSIETPSAVIGVRGTTFVLLVEDDGRTSLLVEEGEVTVTGRGGESVTVSPGMATTVAPAAAPTPPALPDVSLAVAVARMDMLSAIGGAPSSPLAAQKAASLAMSLPANARPASATNIQGASCGG
jgi:hypothetical protein